MNRFLTAVICLALSVFGIVAHTSAQAPRSDRDLFDFPDTTDLYCVYHPSSSQAIALVPAEGVASMVFALTAFDEVTLASLGTQDWQTPDLLEVFPEDTIVLRTTDNLLYKLAFTRIPQEDAPQFSLTYRLLSDDASAHVQTVSLTYDEALNLDTGDTFLDPTVAALVFCDFGPVVPTPTPTTPVPEPGSALLILMGLAGLSVAWKLAQRKGKRSIGLWMVMLFSAFVLVSSGVEWLTAQSNLSCTLVVERDGSGSGVVRGGAIDCGESCRVSHGHGEFLHLKAIPDEESAFSDWLVNGDSYTGLVHMQGDTVLTALFEVIPNDAPIAINDAYTTDEDVPLQVPAAGVLSNDSDPNDDPIQAILVQSPSHGALTFQADGAFSYTPDAYFSGIDHFVYRVHDGDLDSAAAVVTITVKPVENPPVAQDLSVETFTNRPVEIELMGTDPDGEAITYQVITGPAHGSLRGADQQITYTPETDFTGSDSFTYLVNDGTADSDLATVSLLLQEPPFTVDAGPDYLIDEGDTVSLTSASVRYGTLPDTFRASINWGDGGEPEELVISQTDGTGTFTGSHVFVEDGVYRAELTVTGRESGTYSDTFEVTVNNAAPILEPGGDVPLESQLVGVANGMLYAIETETGLVTEIGPTGFEATGLYAIVGLACDFYHRKLYGVFKFAADPQLIEIDPATGQAALIGPIDLIDPFQDVLLAEGLAFHPGDGQLYAVLNTQRDAYSRMFARVDATTGEAELLLGTIGTLSHDADGIELTETQLFIIDFEYSGQYIYRASQDAETVTLLNVDTSGIVLNDLAYDPVSATLYTADWQARNLYSLSEESGEVTLVGPLHDQDGDTIPYMYALAFLPPAKRIPLHAPSVVSLPFRDQGCLDTHTASITWGDGTQEDGMITEAHGSGTINATHAFQEPGSYKVVVTLTDDDGGTDQLAYFVDVIDEQVDVDFEPIEMDTTQAQVDPQSLEILAGSQIDVTVTNHGTTRFHGAYFVTLSREDPQTNTQITIGETMLSHVPAPGEDITVTIPVHGQMAFRDQPIVAVVDRDDRLHERDEDNNLLRQRCHQPGAPLTCEDDSASYIRVDTTDFPTSATIIARIGNSGSVNAAVPLNVAVYEGDPHNGGTLLGVTTTQTVLASGEYEDIRVVWGGPAYGLHEIYVVVDDDGTGSGSIRESDEENNVASATLFVGELPIADAGTDRTVSPGETVTLDGSNSSDPAGYTPLAYSWLFIEIPEGSAAVLDDAASMTPSFTADLTGAYLVQLRVENTQGIQSAVDSVTLTVPASTPPTVSIVSPVDGTEAPLDGSLTILAEAYDEDGAIVKVEFYAQNITSGGENTLFGEVDSAPYSVPWTIVEPGIHEVIARACDDSGVWTDSPPVHLIVQNGQPEMLSEPTYCAPIGALYRYDVEAADPNGDPLTYSLEDGPDGMTIDAVSGLITWTPTAAQVGQHDYRVIVEDGRGAGAGQTVILYVPDADNTPPQITSEPGFATRVGREYVYDVDATDADDDPLTFRLMTAPDGMSIDPSTGLITWMPLEEQIGTHTVTVVADDGRNGLGGQTYSLTILPPNVAPAVTFIQPATGVSVEEGRSVSLQVEASDSDGSIAQVEFSVDDDLLGTHTAPDAHTSVYELAWTAAGLGEHTIYAIAYDNEGASTSSESLTITVIEPLPDTVAPIVEVTAAPQQVQPGAPVTIQLTISDASPIDTVTVTINGVPLTLSDNQASYTVPANDFYTVVAQATDSAGNTGTGQTVFRAFDGSDDTPPVVDLADAVEFHCIELAADQYDLTGSVQDVHPVHYKLLTREKGVNVWETLAEGIAATPLSGGAGVGFNGTLATFDPTLYRNGIHELRLWAQDLAGNEAAVDGCLLLDGRFKVGQASIGGIDVNIPELGSPLLVGRVYDSRNRHNGSFGPGWSLPNEAANVQAEYTYSPSEGWGEEARGSFLKTYYVISHTRKVLVLRLGDGAVFTFRMELSPKSSLLYPIMDASFPMNVIYTPQDGTQATLEPIGVSHEVFLLSENGGTLMDWEGTEYAPTRFKLTLEDGTVYIINQQTGIERITDPYGHQISYSDSQIAHFRSTGSGQASGDVLSIERDTSNHIERITDQLGRTIEYRYDEDGMLQQVIQQGEGPYAMKILEAYAYQQGVAEQPVLKDIYAPDGTRLGAFEYDSQGRKIGLIDHEGHRVLFGYDAPEHHYTVTDRRGNPTSYTYDSDGNVTAVTDADGHTESYSYDADGNVLAHTNKLGYTTASTYDADGNVLTETDPLGNTSTFTYDEDGNTLTATDPLGHTTSFTYDAHGNVLTQQDALGHVTQFAYDADGNLTSTTDALGQTTSFAYDAQGNMTTSTDALGQQVSSTYDLYGRMLSSTDKAGRVTTNEYDGGGLLTKTVDAAGKVHQYTHTDSHKIERYVDPLGNDINNGFDLNGLLTVAKDASGHEVHFDYDPNGNQTTLSTTVTTGNGPENFTIETVYDALNRPTEEIDGDGRSVKAEYDALGRQTAIIDKQGNRTEVSYDPRGLIARQTGPDGSVVSNAYNAAGRLISQTNAQGDVTSYEYNALGNVVKTVAPNGISTDNEYDALGRLVSMSTSEGQNIGVEYDAVGRLTAMTDESGGTTCYEYSPGGRLARTIDPKGNVTAYTYDDSGNVTGMTLPDQSTISYAYDDFGRKVAETDQHGQTTAFAWDESGKLKQVIDAAGHTTQYDYNDIGYLTAKTNANGQTTRYEYDTLGRMTKKTSPLGMSQTFQYGDGNSFSVTDFNGDTVEYTFDRSGRIVRVDLPDGNHLSYRYSTTGDLSRVIDGRGTTSFEYDHEGRLLQRIEPDGRSISYGYDAQGRRTSITVPSGTTQYGYDDDGRLVRVTDPDGETTSYSYDADGNLQQVMYPNGTLTEYGYDTFNRVVSVENRTVTGMIISSSTYTFGPKGERMRVEEASGRSVEYIYDERGQLLEERITDPDGGVRVISYTYDAVGNRLTKTDDGVIITYTYDENDQLLTEGDITYTYDNNGNLLARSGPGLEQRLTYNALNQLVHVDMTSSQGTTTVDYVYDHDGIRVGKTINGTDEVTYLVDANRPYAQVLEEEWTRGLLSSTTNYVYGHGLVSQNIDGNHRFYHYDGFHNTRSLTDMDGAVTDSYRYDAYGTLLNQTGTTSNSYLYRGEQYDSDLDAYYLRARYYQPGTGRFLSTDPVEGNPSDPKTLHRYLYGNNDPVNYFDPSGETSLTNMQMTGAIVGILSGMSTLGWLAGNLGPVGDVYEVLAENLFPDAGIIGLSVFGKGKLAAPTHMRPKTMQALRFISSFLEPSPLNLLIEGMAGVPPISQIWQEPFNAGIVGGVEGIFSFGSGQGGSYAYLGAQVEGGYTRAAQYARWGIDMSLYSGYVFNLWNYKNYLGPFMAVNLPQGSFFCNPGRILGDNPDREFERNSPWGLSRSLFTLPFLSSHGSSQMAGINGTLYYRFPLFGGPKDVTYEELAIKWTGLQIAVTAFLAWSGSKEAAIVNGIAGASTGMIVKSKQIYNKRHNFYADDPQKLYTWEGALWERRNKPRPHNWMSGPENGIGWLLGLVM